jgi:hypothetical protein
LTCAGKIKVNDFGTDQLRRTTHQKQKQKKRKKSGSLEVQIDCSKPAVSSLMCTPTFLIRVRSVAVTQSIEGPSGDVLKKINKKKGSGSAAIAKPIHQ